MADIPPWRRVLEEPNALGWIGFLVLVVAIGIGALYWGPGKGDENTAPKPGTVDHAAR